RDRAEALPQVAGHLYRARTAQCVPYLALVRHLAPAVGAPGEVGVRAGLARGGEASVDVGGRGLGGQVVGGKEVVRGRGPTSAFGHLVGDLGRQAVLTCRVRFGTVSVHLVASRRSPPGCVRNPRRGRQRVNAARGSRAVAASLVVSAVGPGHSGGLEFGAQRRPTPVDAAAYRPHLDAQDVTDLLVAQVLDVAQDDRRPEFRRQVV